MSASFCPATFSFVTTKYEAWSWWCEVERDLVGLAGEVAYEQWKCLWRHKQSGSLTDTKVMLWAYAIYACCLRRLMLFHATYVYPIRRQARQILVISIWYPLLRLCWPVCDKLKYVLKVPQSKRLST